LQQVDGAVVPTDGSCDQEHMGAAIRSCSNATIARNNVLEGASRSTILDNLSVNGSLHQVLDARHHAHSLHQLQRTQHIINASSESVDVSGTEELP